MNYRDRLINFNNDYVYHEELQFLFDLVAPKKGDVIIDIGCGIGTAVEFFRSNSEAEIYGYDVNKYVNGSPDWFTQQIPKTVTKAYFMHSIAHIPKPEELLFQIWKHVKEVVVITPNRDYIEATKPESYFPDPTVINHYNLSDLDALLYRTAYMRQYKGSIGSIGNERIFLKAESQYRP